MLVEGAGNVAPSPVRVRMTASDIEFVREAAARISTYRGYSSRCDRWGRGLLSGKTGPVEVGIRGEFAFDKHLRSRGIRTSGVCTDLLPNGDGGHDITVCGLSTQVKTRSSGRSNVIRRLDRRKRIRTLGADVFVFAQDRISKDREVWLLGWLWSDDVRHVASFERSRVAEHWNLSVPSDRLRPVSDLVCEFQGRSQ